MFKEFNNLQVITQKLDKLVSSNSNRSLSGIFKALRKDQRIRLIGDYPILSFILRFCYYRAPQIVWNRQQILRAINTSGFYLEEGRKHAYIPREWEKYVQR